MPECQGTWAEKALHALADGDNRLREETVAHLSEKFALRASFYYKFDDDSCLQVTRAFGTQVYLITPEKYDSRKVQYDAYEARIRKFEESIGIKTESGKDA